ncbi:hypothetical protein G7054_g7429 [Neopestalotiopsis clavispora]|nr:hypothetical protein G7054_g7429 [Neopestalotiopsis clavispora]
MAHPVEGDPSRLRSALLTALGDFCQVADIFAHHEPSNLDVKFFYHTLFFRCYNLKQLLAGNADPSPIQGFVRGVLSELESLMIAPLGSFEVQNDHMSTFPGLQRLHSILTTLGDSHSRLTTLQEAVAFGGKEKQTALLELLSKGGTAAQPESYIEILESGLAPTQKIRQKPPDNVRSAADSLLTVLKAKGECNCKHIHECVVQLSLETHRAPMSSCQFDLYFGLEKLWQEARVVSAPKPLGIPIVSIQHHTGDSSRGSRKHHRLKFRLEGDCLWRLPPEETNFVIDKSEAPISLTQLLVEQSILFNDRIKRILSVSLGYAVLYLNETPWLSPIWGSCNVMFFRSSGGFLMRPYLRNELDNDAAAHQVDSDSDDEGFDPEELLLPPCPCLIGLAIVLMEVHKAASFQTLLEVYDIGSTEQTGLATRFTTTRDLFECCRYDFTDQTRMAISACLDPNIDLDDSGETLDDSDLQSIIYERIVRNLEDELEQGFSDVTVDQLDDLIQTLDLATGGQPPHETKLHRPRSRNILPISSERFGIGHRVQYLSSEMNATPDMAENVYLTPNVIVNTSGGRPPSEQMRSSSNPIAPTAASIETHRNFVAPLVPSKSPLGRPDTIRVMNIPDDMSRPDLREKLERLFASECKIHSLARGSRDAHWKKYATVTFPELHNNTLTETIAKLQHQVLDDHFAFDRNFLDLTPVYDGGELAIVE